MPAPANDNFANAQAITGASGSVAGTTVSATIETNEPLSNYQYSVWYLYTAVADGVVQFSVPTYDGGIIDMFVGAYSGTGGFPSSDARLFQFDPTIPNPLTSTIGKGNIRLSNGEQVYLLVKTYQSTGAFTLSWSTVTPANGDQFVDALTAVEGANAMNFSGATWEAGELGANASSHKTVWRTFTAPSTGDYVFALRNDAAAYAYRATGKVYRQDGVGIAGLTDLLSGGIFSNTVYDATVSLTSGQIIYVNAAYMWDDSADLVLTFPPPPPTPPANDDWANRTTINASGGSLTGEKTYGATHEVGEYNNYSYAGAEDQSVWYEFTPGTTGFWTFTFTNPTLHGASGYVGMESYTGASLAGLSMIWSYNPHYFPGGGTVSLSFSLTAGTTYSIRVYSPQYGGPGSWAYSLDSFDMAWSLVTGWPGSPAPPNDDLANAITLSGSGSGTGTTVHASLENSDEWLYFGTPLMRDVWYKVAPGPFGHDVTLSFSKTGGTGIPYVELFLPLTEPISGFIDLDYTSYLGDGTDTPPPVTWSIPANTTAYICVEEWNYSTEEWSFSFTYTITTPTPPTNDDIANAMRIYETGGSDTEYVNLATMEPGETAHGGTKSVWYYFVARRNGNWTFLVDGGTTGRFLYTAPAYPATIASLSPVSNLNDVTPGTVYYIQVIE